MGDEIKQSDTIARVLPLNPSRNTGQRKRPPKPPQDTADSRRRKDNKGDPDQPPHQVDEYV